MCYNVTYKSRKYDKFEKDLIVLGALIQATEEDEAKKIIKRINISKEVKESIEGVLDSMSKDDLKWGRSYIKEEEEERIRKTTINLIEKRALAEGKELGIEQNRQEVIINMYKEGYDIADISKIVRVDISKIEKIIENSIVKTKRK